MNDFRGASNKCGGAAGVAQAGLQNTAKPTGMLVSVAATLEAHAVHLEAMANKFHRLGDTLFGSNPTSGSENSEKDRPPDSHADAIGRLNRRIVAARSDLESALNRLEQLV